MKGSYFIIPLVIYPFDIMVSIDEKDEILLKRLIKYGNIKEDCKNLLNLKDTIRGRYCLLSSNQSVIRLKKQLDKYEMIDVISHEVFHTITYILDKVGISLELCVSDEVYAYLIGYLNKEICKRLKI